MRVTVVNPVPLPVTVAGTPFQAVVCKSAAFGSSDLPDCSGHDGPVTIPTDRRAVIQLVSVGCGQRNVDIINISVSTQVGDVRAEYPVHLEAGTFAGSRLEGALQGPIYADPGSTVGGSFGASAPGTVTSGSVRCEVVVSGLLIAN